MMEVSTQTLCHTWVGQDTSKGEIRGRMVSLTAEEERRLGIAVRTQLGFSPKQLAIP